MANTGISGSQVSTMTECSICMDTFTEPKSLPCAHTFCLCCLEDWYGKNGIHTNPGDKVKCPTCRQVFIVPRRDGGGLKKLPNNITIVHLLECSQLSNAELKEGCVACELCTDSPAAATAYCIECVQHLCERCCVRHKNLKLAKGHKVTSLKDKPSEKELVKIAPRYCQKHFSKTIEYYCYDCKTVSCVSCLADHVAFRHKYSDLKASADEFCVQFDIDIRKVAEYIVKGRDRLKQLEENRNLLISQVKAAKDAITEIYNQMRSALESHKKMLMTKAKSFEDKKRNELETRRNEEETVLQKMESFKSYCEQIKENGSSCDIAYTADSLRVTADELFKTQEELMRTQMTLPVDIRLLPLWNTVAEKFQFFATVTNWIGELVFQAEVTSQKPAAQVHQTYALKSRISGENLTTSTSAPQAVSGGLVVGYPSNFQPGNQFKIDTVPQPNQQPYDDCIQCVQTVLSTISKSDAAGIATTSMTNTDQPLQPQTSGLVVISTAGSTSMSQKIRGFKATTVLPFPAYTYPGKNGPEQYHYVSVQQSNGPSLSSAAYTPTYSPTCTPTYSTYILGPQTANGGYGGTRYQPQLQTAISHNSAQPQTSFEMYPNGPLKLEQNSTISQTMQYNAAAPPVVQYNTPAPPTVQYNPATPPIMQYNSPAPPAVQYNLPVPPTVQYNPFPCAQQIMQCYLPAPHPATQQTILAQQNRQSNPVVPADPQRLAAPHPATQQTILAQQNRQSNPVAQAAPQMLPVQANMERYSLVPLTIMPAVIQPNSFGPCGSINNEQQDVSGPGCMKVVELRFPDTTQPSQTYKREKLPLQIIDPKSNEPIIFKAVFTSAN